MYQQLCHEKLLNLNDVSASLSNIKSMQMPIFKCRLCNVTMSLDEKRSELFCPRCWEVIDFNQYAFSDEILEIIKNHKTKCVYCSGTKLANEGYHSTKFKGKIMKCKCLECSRKFSSNYNDLSYYKHYPKFIIIHATKLILSGATLQIAKYMISQKYNYSPTGTTISAYSKDSSILKAISMKEVEELKKVVESESYKFKEKFGIRDYVRWNYNNLNKINYKIIPTNNSFLIKLSIKNKHFKTRLDVEKFIDSLKRTYISEEKVII